MGATSIYVNTFKLVIIIIDVQAINVDNGLSLLYLFACTEVTELRLSL